MSAVLAFAVIQNVLPQQAFVSANAEIRFGDQVIAGRIFLARRHGQVAACVRVTDTYTGTGNLAKLAMEGCLNAVADTDDEDGCAIVSRVWLSVNGGHGSSWREGQDRETLGVTARSWWAHILLASMSESSRQFRIPAVTGRPAGQHVTEVSIVGDIGSGRNTSARVASQLGDPDQWPNTISLRFDSRGGNAAEGLAIYRLLSEWPYAVHAHIRRAESSAAVCALAADVRKITPSGTMMIHGCAVEDLSGRYVSSDLRQAANRIDELDGELARVIAQRTGSSPASVRAWMATESRFNAGAALSAGLVHAIEQDDVPVRPKVVRASFAPINGPYRSLRLK